MRFNFLCEQKIPSHAFKVLFWIRAQQKPGGRGGTFSVGCPFKTSSLDILDAEMSAS